MFYLHIKSYFKIQNGSNIKQMYNGKSKNSDINLCGVGNISYFFYYLCYHDSQDIC